MRQCDRCGREIGLRETSYHVWVWVVASMNEELDGRVDEDLDQAVSQVTERLGPLPADLVASEVYARRSYFVCPWCQERILANPLGK